MITRVSVCFFVLLSLSLQAATVEVVSIPSPKMGKSIPATIILPDAYGDGDERFPVTYLLHGAGGSHAGWDAQADIAAVKIDGKRAGGCLTETRRREEDKVRVIDRSHTGDAARSRE